MALVPHRHPTPPGRATPGYGGARGRRPLGPWHKPRGAVPWVGVTATRSPSPSYLVTEMSASSPGITAGPPALPRCPLHPAAASPRDGDVLVPLCRRGGDEEGSCSALARGEDGEGRTSPSPSRQCCLCSRAQALSNSFPRTPARAAGGKAAREHRLGAHSPPRGPACPPATLQGKHPAAAGMSCWQMALPHTWGRAVSPPHVAMQWGGRGTITSCRAPVSTSPPRWSLHGSGD